MASYGIYFVFLAVLAQNVRGQMRSCQDIIPAVMSEYRGCVDYMYQILFSLDYQDVNSENVQRRCMTNTYVQCRQAAVQKIGSCLVFMQREALDIVFRLVDAGLGYWCGDYGKNLLEFYRQRGPDCYFQQQSFLRSCEAENPLVNMRLASYDTDYCRIQDSVMGCMMQIYERCLSRESPDLIRGYFNAMWRVTPCSMGSGSALPLLNHSPSLSSGSTISFSVISTVLLIMLRR